MPAALAQVSGITNEATDAPLSPPLQYLLDVLTRAWNDYVSPVDDMLFMTGPLRAHRFVNLSMAANSNSIFSTNVIYLNWPTLIFPANDLWPVEIPSWQSYQCVPLDQRNGFEGA